MEGPAASPTLTWQVARRFVARWALHIAAGWIMIALLRRAGSPLASFGIGVLVILAPPLANLPRSGCVRAAAAPGAARCTCPVIADVLGNPQHRTDPYNLSQQRFIK